MDSTSRVIAGSNYREIRMKSPGLLIGIYGYLHQHCRAIFLLTSALLSSAVRPATKSDKGVTSRVD